MPGDLECFPLARTADDLVRMVDADARDSERIHTAILKRLPGVAGVQSILALRTVKKTVVLPV